MPRNSLGIYCVPTSFISEHLQHAQNVRGHLELQLHHLQSHLQAALK